MFKTIDEYSIKESREVNQKLKYEGSICISGLTASGKTTHSHLLAGEFGLTYVSASQIQLNFLGVSPVQSRDFWITPQAKSLWNKEQFDKIDEELLNIENQKPGCMFDSVFMPWRHQNNCFKIWLESSLDSRIIKSIISHRGLGNFHFKDYRDKILSKDKTAINLAKEMYGFDLENDRSCFDLIIDISTLVKKPTFEEAIRSIRITHSIIRSSVLSYLIGSDQYLSIFKKLLDTHRSMIIFSRI